jgi:hypothetical protein
LIKCNPAAVDNHQHIAHGHKSAQFKSIEYSMPRRLAGDWLTRYTFGQAKIGRKFWLIGKAFFQGSPVGPEDQKAGDHFLTSSSEIKNEFSGEKAWHIIGTPTFRERIAAEA